jgi:hypothetical protein
MSACLQLRLEGQARRELEELVIRIERHFKVRRRQNSFSYTRCLPAGL